MSRNKAGNEKTFLKISPPISSVLGIWKFNIPAGGYHEARSTPGHLLHLVTSGEYRMRTNRREYNIKPGDVIYYHEIEEVEWLGNEKPVTFYSVAFLAQDFEPLPLDQRVLQSTSRLRGCFEKLYEANTSKESIGRKVRIYGLLLDILWQIEGLIKRDDVSVRQDALWWRIEESIRRSKKFRPALDEITDIGNTSRATILRACRKATGMSPGKRIQKLRMEEARGLLMHSPLNVSQVAEYLGYQRVHEFSREFSGYFGHPPSNILAKNRKKI